MSTSSLTSKRGIAVDLPGHLGEPLMIRRHGWRARIERPDGSELPTDRWGNRLAEGADGSRVRVRPALGQGDFCHAVRIDDEVVNLEAPLDRRERRWIFAASLLVVVPGLVLAVMTHSVGLPSYLVGSAVAWRGAWIAARQLRRVDDPHRRTRAAVTMGIAVCVALAAYAVVWLVS